MNAKRITLFAGHYGSGKTNVALNYARMLRRSGEKVAIADLVFLCSDSKPGENRFGANPKGA